MDDFILIHNDKDFLEQCLNKIEEKLKEQGMEINVTKTYIQKVSEPISYLGFVYRLTKSGKVVILADPKKIKHERKKILRMRKLVDQGKLTKHDVDMHFKAYKTGVRYGNSHNLIYRLNKWYKSLWEGTENG